MVRTEEFQPEHLELIQARSVEVGCVRDLGDVYHMSCTATTVFLGDDIITIWGVIPTQVGHYLWQIPSVHIRDNTIKYAKQVKVGVQSIITTYPNLYTFIRDDVFHKRWMEFINFSPAERFTLDGVDFVTYRIKNNGIRNSDINSTG